MTSGDAHLAVDNEKILKIGMNASTNANALEVKSLLRSLFHGVQFTEAQESQVE